MGVDPVVEILEQNEEQTGPAAEAASEAVTAAPPVQDGDTAPQEQDAAAANADGETVRAEEVDGETIHAEEVGALDDVEQELALRKERAHAAESAAAREARIKNISERFDSNVDYTTVLDGFEGPLDLLLYLIEKEDIEIKDIFVSQVTEQFLAYMRGLPYLDVDKVTDYLNIAATILRIKAQSLVPVVGEMADYWDDSDVEEDKQELIRAIEDYKRIKEEVDELKKRETIGYYFRAPDREIGATKTVYSLDDLTLDGLVEAISSLLLKRGEEIYEEDEIREIPQDEYTVAQKIQFILSVFEQEQEVCFEKLFTRDSSRSEIVTTFQALLELLKHQYLRIRQPEAFGQIYISFNSESSHVWVGEEIDEYE